jgi:hypothetical protein
MNQQQSKLSHGGHAHAPFISLGGKKSNLVQTHLTPYAGTVRNDAAHPSEISRSMKRLEGVPGKHFHLPVLPEGNAAMATKNSRKTQHSAWPESISLGQQVH